MKLNSIKYFYPEKPVLMMIDSDAFQEISDSDEWIAEPKFNGSRCELHLLNGHVEFWDRHGKHLKYNDDILNENDRNDIIADIKSRFGNQGYFVFDCELRHNKVIGIRNKLVLYDIHVFNNEILNQLTFKERRSILEKYFKKNDEKDRVHLIYQYHNDFLKVFNNYLQDDEIEGLVLKRLDGKLVLSRVAGVNSIWMMKVRKKSNRYRY